MHVGGVAAHSLEIKENHVVLLLSPQPMGNFHPYDRYGAENRVRSEQCARADYINLQTN